MQNGGCLGLIASLGIPLISALVGSLMGKGLQTEWPKGLKGSGKSFKPAGKGLQIDSTPRNYRRIPINDEKKSQNF